MVTKVIESIGIISKKEFLAGVEEDFCNGAMVLETLYPFPGYYHKTIPDIVSLNPRSLFLLTKAKHTDEEITRAYHRVKKTFRKTFNAAPGEVVFLNHPSTCIRIHALCDYHDLPALIEQFRKAGIVFEKYRTVEPYEGIIKVRKFFELRTISPGIYKDAKNHEMCYFVVPAELSWEQFEKIVMAIKRNMDENRFDAALGAIYLKDCLVDLIRIYEEDINTERLSLIKEKFLSEVEKVKLS